VKRGPGTSGGAAGEVDAPRSRRSSSARQGSAEAARRPHVVVVGGGFAGLEVSRRLARAPVDITLLDRTNHHTFQPLLYQVATAGLNPADIAAPIRRILRGQENVTVLLADVLGIDVDERELRLEDDSCISYDYLVVATGVTHSYFGKDELAEFAPGLKTIDDGLSIRQRIFLAFEEAERSADDAKAVEAWLSFVVVGAGPTGVELAGALAEIAKRTLPREFRRMNPAKARVLLLEGGDRVLPAYSAALSAKAERSLEKLGVEVRTRTRVLGVDAEGVDTDQGRIGARTVLWAAGVAGSPLAQALGVPLDRAGRVLVEPTLSIPGHDEVFVVGDLAHVEQDGELVPGVAPAATQGARVVAANILASLDGAPRVPFRYVDKGMMATIGRAAAVARMGKLELSGLVAWLAWLFIHILFLIGFKNRLIVLIQWAWAYLRFDRGSRLVHGGVSSRSIEPPVLSSRSAALGQQAELSRQAEPAPPPR
jgi:NADH:ubiquinone reductase (H+-translocating)